MFPHPLTPSIGFLLGTNVGLDGPGHELIVAGVGGGEDGSSLSGDT